MYSAYFATHSIKPFHECHIAIHRSGMSHSAVPALRSRAVVVHGVPVVVVVVVSCRRFEHALHLVQNLLEVWPLLVVILPAVLHDSVKPEVLIIQ